MAKIPEANFSTITEDEDKLLEEETSMSMVFEVS